MLNAIPWTEENQAKADLVGVYDGQDFRWRFNPWRAMDSAPMDREIEVYAIDPVCPHHGPQKYPALRSKRTKSPLDGS